MRSGSDPAHAVRDYIPAQILPPDVDPRTALLDPHGAIFHTTIMGITLALLVGTSFVPGGSVQVWMITAAGGSIAFLRDLWSERNVKPRPAVEEIELTAPGTPSTLPTTIRPCPRLSLPYLASIISRRFPMTSSTISRLPLSLLPFAGGVFVLARALTSLGWTSIFASWLAKISSSPASAVFFLGYFVAFVLCPLAGTNIGATILVVEILRDANFASAPHVLADPRIMQGAIFSTALASNLGAVGWTFSSSLAGLLWVTILRQKGIRVTGREFAAWNMWFLPVLSTVASAIGERFFYSRGLWGVSRGTELTLSLDARYHDLQFSSSVIISRASSGGETGFTNLGRSMGRSRAHVFVVEKRTRFGTSAATP